MNARRGCVPDDDRNFSLESVKVMRRAAGQILWLMEEGYDLKPASVFVGNHFLLSERQRTAIARTVATGQQVRDRTKKRKSPGSLEGQTVFVDGFNEIITLEVMLSHSPVFACMDGAIRDLAALRGTYRLIPETDEAIRMMLEVLDREQVSNVNIFLDAPVSNSGRLKTRIAEIGEVYHAKLFIELRRDVDRALYDRDNVITSDSVVLDHCRSWFNLTAECVERTGTQLLQVFECKKAED